jgi:Helicase HerA, central domain
MLPELFKRLKPLYGKRIDQLWFEFQLADPERKQEISNLLTVLAIKRLGIGIGEERIVLDPPPASVIGRGTYTIGSVSYPGIAGYEFRLAPEELLRHLFILGPTGTGKSTLIIGLLQQLLLDGVPFMCFDFKRNYRCLLDAPCGDRLVVITVGRDAAPLRVNALQPPPGVEFEEWIAGLADLISTSYLLMQGARNVLIEGFRDAYRERGGAATFLDAHRILDAELQSLRSGSRRYGWLESSARSLEELTRGGYGKALNAHDHGTFADLLGLPVVFELQGLGDDQKRFFCLFALHAVLQLRKNDNSVREILRHVLVFDEAHNIFPKEQFGQLGVPSRLAREVREYGEAIIAATQQADIAESLIANSGTKIILRTDYPKDVDFASKLLQIEPRWLAKLPLGTGIARLPTRYYSPFLFTFPPQPRKNTLVSDHAVGARYDRILGRTTDESEPTASPPTAVTDKEGALVRDIAQYPIAGITARYTRLGWNPKIGNSTKDNIITKGLATFDDVPTSTARIKILTLTPDGIAYLNGIGITLPSWRRGGPAHEYWRATIRQRLERHGYTVTDEYSVGEQRAVDLHATKNGHTVFVEIETGKSDIRANIEKCRSLSGLIVFFFVTSELRDAWHAHLASMANAVAITPTDLERLAEALQ